MPVKSSNKIFSKVLWFNKRTRFDIDYFDLLQSRREVSLHPRYRSGLSYSEKCGRDIQYESALEGSLWGVFDKRIGDTIYLESSSLNLQNFRKWHLLPIAYRFCRLATRSELRDYTANLIWSEKSCLLSKPRLAYEQA